MNSIEIARMLDRDRGEWQALVALLDARTGFVHSGDSHQWTASDVYNHFARWMDHSTTDFQAHLVRAHRPPLEGTDDEINARWKQEDAALSYDEARSRAHRAFDARIKAIQSVPADGWDAVLEAIAHADGYKHIAEHRRYIELSQS